MPSVFFFMDSKAKIEKLRILIDKIDDQLFDLLVERFDVSKKIGDIKAKRTFFLRNGCSRILHCSFNLCVL